MPRGGARPNAGRPRKHPVGTAPKAKVKRNKRAVTEAAPPIDPEVKREARKSGLTPLEYMLDVVNDEGADELRRDRMAVAAAPYVHPKAGEVPLGKKEQRQVRAEEATSAGKFAVPSGPKLVVDNRR